MFWAEILKVTLIDRYLLPVGIAYLLFYVILKNRIQKFKISGTKITKEQLWHEFSASLLTRILFISITFGIIFARNIGVSKTYTGINSNTDWTYFVFSLVCLFLFHDAYFYWTHRRLHSNKWLRINVHNFHHKSLNPTPLAANSFHPIEAIINGFYLIIAVVIIPIHPMAILIESLASVFLGVYAHLGYEFIPVKIRNSFLGKYIMTATNHNFHHSRFKSNYGFYFLFWDRLCGTLSED